MNISELRELIEQEIDSYIHEDAPDAIGSPMSKEWVVKQLAEFKSALVQPAMRIVQVSDTVQQMRLEIKSEMRECILVADDREGYELYYDPIQDDFFLAHSGNPPTTFNVRGDAVGCFLSR
jgi:hypothetical protein